MMQMDKILRFGRRQLHTIISREIIKPASPTPSHLHTYHLSQNDKNTPHYYAPLIFFYPSTNNRNHQNSTANDKARKLKNSLSQTLTRYYPFAGRLNSPYKIDCNDEGVVFVEAKNDGQLDKFQHISEGDPAVNQLFADGMVWEHQNRPRRTYIMGVQLNHFACGGIGLAVSISHRIGDGCTIGSYMAHWASVARYGSTDHKENLPFNPHFIQSPPTMIDSPRLESFDSSQGIVNYVTRKFVFPNTKLNDLKNKVDVNNPTRVEVLTSLIYKTAVAACPPTVQSGSFKPSFLVIPINLRGKFVPKLPETTVGNFLSLMLVTTRSESETTLSKVVSEIRKEKMEAKNRAQSTEQARDNVATLMSRLQKEDLEYFGKRAVWSSSLCGFPYNKVDFGWGSPTCVTVLFGSSNVSGFMLMDTPDGNGIQARVKLEKQNMEIFENDKELLSFCQV